MTEPLRWSRAMHAALYGPNGFYTRHSPHRHFRTSAQSPVFAGAIARLLRRVDTGLGSPQVFTFVDVGAGSGELLSRVLELDDLDGRLRPVAVEVRVAPAGLDPRIAWRSQVPEAVCGLLLACELLDNVPLDVAVLDEAGAVRYELVDPDTGDTALGEPVDAADARWLADWWPLRRPGDRAEIGRGRDARWARLRAAVSRGTALAVDYGHTRDRRPAAGTITGFRDGRQVAPIPDGSRDVTAHVAMDSLGAGRLCTQREALRELGVSGARPPLELSRTDPLGYVRALSRSTEAADLTTPTTLGNHQWLMTELGAD